MRRFIFLDIDSVLNSRDWNHLYRDNDNFKYNPDIDPDIDFRAVKRINKLVEVTGAEIILGNNIAVDLFHSLIRITAFYFPSKSYIFAL